jgi:hypothetical protein
MSHREDWEIAAPAVQRAWVSGNRVILREVRQGQVYSAKPVTVVCDRPDLVALWIAPGTRWKHALRPDGGPVEVDDIMRDRWVLADAVWYGGGALILQIPSAAHCLLGFREQHREALACWYINLQEPLRRAPLGFDTLDQILDIVVSPDRRWWAWKDEEDFAEAERQGLIHPTAARAVRTEGERALRLLLAGAPPFAPEWARWAPDPAWSVPTLPPGWKAVTVSGSKPVPPRVRVGTGFQ